MAALRRFTRSELSNIILRSCGEYISLNRDLPIITQKRWGKYKTSPQYTESSKYTDYEVTKDPQEWEYVERLLKPKSIPIPCLENKEYPSGWKPPISKPQEYPYYIQRTKNYMQPVYLEIFHRGLRRITTVRKIHGNIWILENELKEYLEKNVKKSVGVRTNELSGQIQFRGDYVNLIKAWMNEKGF
ncbi:large ribosomal subunit protein mL49 [Apis cerana]|uniref:Large ribosomal subunit protein mL49 n=1 Tax=Apis cerana cerana TaxID=94128 RepID=A0A2A3EMS9_APICC|nr:large ribosomal subunit protein mL49 [Apis cerana]PBC32572.1 39S ribosomal protein L49 [Apis cerana cerana]